MPYVLYMVCCFIF